MVFFRAISRLPFWFLYFLADVIYGLNFYVVGYRKQVVLSNLRKAFPEKNEKEIQQIAKGFYRNLADVIVETLKTLSITEDEVRRRVKVVNSELVRKWVEQEQKIVLMTAGHLCNWEWLGLMPVVMPGIAFEGVYKPLSSPFFGKLMDTIRTRFGYRMTPMASIFRSMVTDKTPRVIGLGSDQNPDNPHTAYWTIFFDQETPFMNGHEKMAMRFGYPLVFVDIVRVGRGYYEFVFTELASPPYTGITDHYLNQVYVDKLESAIRKHPANWLWSHRRWKHQRERQAVQ
ncbi:MAG: lysophospholipid acyltransferase family protein [Spirosomataceae bacterium]